jgi:iron complex outermembrane receptor protein
MVAFLVVGLIAAFQPAMAGEKQKQMKAYKIEEIVVTATRTEMMVKDVPASVTIVTRDDMDKMHVKTADDALNKLAGVRVNRGAGITTSEGHPTIIMRGVGGWSCKRILVLKDGVPLHNTAYGSAYHFNQMPTDDIERIEVVRGASSALYGSSGMGGVINIITKPPEKKTEGSLSFEYGRGDTRIYNCNASRGLDKIGFKLSAGGKNSNGYKYYKKWRPYYKEPEIDIYNISPEIYLKLGKSKLKLQYERFDEETFSAKSIQYDGDKETNKYTFNYTISIAKTDINAKFYYFDRDSNLDADKYNKKTGRYDKFYYHSDIPKDDLGLMLQASREIKDIFLTVGSDLKWGDMESDYNYDKGPRYYEGDQKQYSGFLHAEYPLFNDKFAIKRRRALRLVEEL